MFPILNMACNTFSICVQSKMLNTTYVFMCLMANPLGLLKYLFKLDNKDWKIKSDLQGQFSVAESNHRTGMENGIHPI